jgi:serine protease Do
MKQHLLRITGLAILALFLQTSCFAQDDNHYKSDDDMPHKYDEIVIRHKSGKDAKVTIEIKDGDVLVNGKPVTEYEDSSLTIHRRKVSNGFSWSSPDIVSDMPDIKMFPGGGGNWSFSNDGVYGGNRAQLGVMSEKTESGKGAKVTSVTKGSAAEKIGLKLGDVILKIDNEEIGNSQSLRKTIGEHKPGDKVEVTYSHDGKEQKQTAVLGKTKAITVEPMNGYSYEMPDMPHLRTFDEDNMPKEFRVFSDRSIKFGIRAQDAEDGKGVKVLDVDDESTAAKAGIKEGDVITRFDGRETNSVTALTSAAHDAREKVSVKVTIVRDGKAQEIDVRVPRRLRTADL